MQVGGLVLETAADWQKSHFKALHRLEWCRHGVWRFSTHPNYAGEWIFWCGTILAALPFIWTAQSSVAVRLVQMVIVLVGFSFLSTILAGAAQKLGDKQMAKYGDNPEYVRYRERTRVFGLVMWPLRQQQDTYVVGDVDVGGPPQEDPAIL